MSIEDPERSALGSRLAAARNDAGLTGSEVAAKLDYKSGRKAVSAWETGRAAPDAIVLKHLCRLYQVSADSLLWGPEEAQPAAAPPLDPALLRQVQLLSPAKRALLEEQLRTTLKMLIPTPSEASAATETESGKPRRAA